MKSFLKLSTFLFITILAFACKPSGEKAETGAAAEVAAEVGTKYMINTADSKILWEGSKLTGTHNGDMKLKNGEIAMDNGKITGGSFVIDMTSINVLDLEGGKKAGLESHLKGTGEEEKKDHFFNVGMYPEAKFEITKATKLLNDENANYIISGNLTLRDQTKEVRFKANMNKSDDMIKVSTPPFTINRTEWGVNYGSASLADGMKDKAINDNIGLEIKLVASK
jgi:polyisoprenoid-binding protein YceI